MPTLVLSGDVLGEEEVRLTDTTRQVTTDKIRFTPEKVLRKMLDDELYNPVRLVLQASDERSLKYCCLPNQAACLLEEDFGLVGQLPDLVSQLLDSFIDL
jgi:hypothetical protein